MIIMTQTTARIKQKGKHFEILVDLDAAVKFKKTGVGNLQNILEIDTVYSDHKKGFKAPEKDLMEAFGTEDIYKIAETVLKNGEILLTQEYRDEEKDKKIKQVVDFLCRNAIDPRTGLPHTPERIKNVLEEAGVNITNKSIEEQIPEIMEKISSKIAIKIQTKRIKIVIPAIHTGKAYGVISPYKQSEEWLSDGSLEVVVAIPAGSILEFYDKLNSVTHGSALTEEIKE